MITNDIFKSKLMIFIAINFAIFIAKFTTYELNIYIEKYLPLFSIDQANFRFWQFFTYIFVHGDFFHIFFNMLAILFLGARVEQILGFKTLFIICLLSGSLTGIIYCIMFNKFVLIGSSAITYGILIAFTYIFPKEKLAIFGIIPVEARIITLGLLLFDFIAPMLISNAYIMKDNIAHFAHIFGATISFAFLEIKYKKYLNF